MNDPLIRLTFSLFCFYRCQLFDPLWVVRRRAALYCGAAAGLCEEHQEERRLSAHEPDHPASGARVGFQETEVGMKDVCAVLNCLGRMIWMESLKCFFSLSLLP